jgi:uncharacterized protein (DUF58 family)
MNFFAKSRSSAKFQERHQKTYILPTLYGVFFGVVCILLLGIAFVSTNNAVYFLCFLLTVLGIQSLILTNSNSDRLDIGKIEVEDFFADEAGFAKVSVHNPSPEVLRDLDLEISTAKPLRIEALDVNARRELRVALPTLAMGVHTVPPLRISSEFPFFLSRSWKKFYSDSKFYVFPARKGASEFSAEAHAQAQALQQSFDDFKNHRDYQMTDSPSRIDWKVSARVQKTLVKEYESQTSVKVVLRWEDCPQISDEDKKSQLSLWIDLAEKKNFEYSLVLPNRHIALGRGPQHRQQCLRALL